MMFMYFMILSSYLTYCFLLKNNGTSYSLVICFSKKQPTHRPSPQPTNKPSNRPTPAPTTCDSRTWYYNSIKGICENPILEYDLGFNAYSSIQECCKTEFGNPYNDECLTTKHDECCYLEYPVWYYNKYEKLCTNDPYYDTTDPQYEYESKTDCCEAHDVVWDYLFDGSCNHYDICEPATPTLEPTPNPTNKPSNKPTDQPTFRPSPRPTEQPSNKPTSMVR